MVPLQPGVTPILGPKLLRSCCEESLEAVRWSSRLQVMPKVSYGDDQRFRNIIYPSLLSISAPAKQPEGGSSGPRQ